MEVITFNELRRIKDKLPAGSMQKIANDLNLNVDLVLNSFGGDHSGDGCSVGFHIEKGPDGGVVTLDDRTILDYELKLLKDIE